jgi:hypothetical protein
VPSLGGQERRLIDVVGSVRSLGESLLPFLSWSPDGQWLALSEKASEEEPARIVRVSLATLEKEPLTSPPGDSFGDLYPELSPDGQQIAFVRVASRTWGLQDVWVQSVKEPLARQVTFAKYKRCSGLSWTGDGAELVFSTETDGTLSGGQIVRAPLAGGDPTPVAGVGSDVAWASVRGGRMHTQLVLALGIWRMPGRRSSRIGAEKLTPRAGTTRGRISGRPPDRLHFGPERHAKRLGQRRARCQPCAADHPRRPDRQCGKAVVS